MSDHEYLNRIRKIDDDRVCAHIRALTIVDGVNEHGRPCKLVIAEVKPYGPMGKYMEASLRNPHQNTYCSVRSITRDNMQTGIKYTTEISTWDMVGEGGIYTANKFNSPALEAFATKYHEGHGHEITITPVTLIKASKEHTRLKGLGLESSNYDVTELAEKLGWDLVPNKARPAYMRWK